MTSRPSRPGSGSTASTFGASFTPKLKNMQVTSKVSNYQTNGSGRDSYIKVNNGGFTTKLENSYRKIYTGKHTPFDVMKATNIHPKVVIYKTNGLGRDSYIYTACGGFYKDKDYPNPSTFNNTLRSYDKKSGYSKNDFIHFSRTFLGKDEYVAKKALALQQRATSARLAKRSK